MGEIDEKAIAIEAYRIWQKAGCPDGSRKSTFWKDKTIAEAQWMAARMNLESSRDCSPEILKEIAKQEDGWQENFRYGSYRGRNLTKPRKNNNIIIKDGKMIHGGVFKPEIQLDVEDYDNNPNLKAGWTIEEEIGVCCANLDSLSKIEFIEPSLVSNPYQDKEFKEKTEK